MIVEDLQWADDGFLDFLDYLLPTASDVPDIEHGHIETPALTPPVPTEIPGEIPAFAPNCSPLETSDWHPSS